MSPQPRLDAAALIGLPGQVAALYRGYADPVLLLLVWLAAASAHFGRRAGVRVRGAMVYCNLHAAMEDWSAARSALRAVSDFFQLDIFAPHPTVVEAGVRDAQTLVFIVRDQVTRYEKSFDPNGGTPRFTPTKVDPGTSERRLVIAQSLRAHFHRRSAASASLRAALMSSYFGEDLVAFVAAGGAVGYYLRSTGTHVALVTDAAPADLASVIFLPKVESDLPAPFTPGTEPEPMSLLDAQLAFEAALYHEFAPELRLERSAQTILNTEANALAAFSPLVEIKLAKAALTYCLADAGDIITARHALAAAAILRYCTNLQRHHEDQAHRDSLAARICGALAAAPKGLTTSKLARKLHILAADLNTALLELLAAGRIARTVLPTPGRSRTTWTGR
jgi:hypothetical protein